MNHPRRYQFFLFIVIINNLINVLCESNTTPLPHTKNEPVEAGHMSNDFANFIEGLGSMVYNKHYQSSRKPPKKFRATKSPMKETRLESLNGIEAGHTMGDLLMLKLVSYYEDKYKVAHHTPEYVFANEHSDYESRMKTPLRTPENRRFIRRERSKRITAEPEILTIQKTLRPPTSLEILSDEVVVL